MFSSVIICTHNPREDYLQRVLDALKAQTLPQEQWELLLIDNASKEPLAGKWDLSWHPSARHIREEELGLTPARLRGIREARSELLVFVDDDNLLASDFLAQSNAISESHGFLGAWGAGVIQPEFEAPPPPWMHSYAYLIALRNAPADCWSNLTDTDITLPCGAGLCVRSKVAKVYSKAVERDSPRRKLDRVGNGFGCAGDLDLALTSIDLGLGMGMFTSLKVTHIIPATRIQESYLVRLAEGNSYSGLTLAARRGRAPKIRRISGVRAILGKLRRFMTMRPRERRMLEAQIRGQQRALKDLACLHS